MMNANAVDRAWRDLTLTLDRLNDAAVELTKVARTPDEMRVATALLQQIANARERAYSRHPAVVASSLFHSTFLVPEGSENNL